MDTQIRRYDIDWLRVIAIAILLVFHIMIMFQSYARLVLFIESPVLLKVLLIPLSLLSVMRIPLLFFISGMGVYFSLQRRTWLQLLGERTIKILVPLLFGSFAIVPIHAFIYAKFYSEEFIYAPNMGHLWFLCNILLYVLWFLAIFYFAKEIQNSKFFNLLRKLIEKYPYGIYLLAIPYILQALTIPAEIPYALFYDSRVGLLLGAIAFLLGFTFITIGEVAWEAISKFKYYSLGLALIIFVVRGVVFEFHGPHVLTSIESISWIFGILGLGYAHLNKPSRILAYLSQAAYPFYILHMIFLYWGAYIIFPLNINVWASLLFIVAFTFTGCYLSYEIIRRIFFLRPLFGLKLKK
ncbi:MAG: acyltransferase [FCB group bacterium]|nr:acyltransferase [FCB group bacterium]